MHTEWKLIKRILLHKKKQKKTEHKRETKMICKLTRSAAYDAAILKINFV